MTDHQHAMGIVVEVTAPVGDPPGHTKFLMLSCACGLVQLFPHSNFLLTSPDFQIAFRRRITGEGYRLEEA